MCNICTCPLTVSLCPSRCHLLNLQQKTAGTSAADAQCGERSFNVGAAVGGAVGVLIVIIGGGGLLLLWHLKKRAPSNR